MWWWEISDEKALHSLYERTETTSLLFNKSTTGIVGLSTCRRWAFLNFVSQECTSLDGFNCGIGSGGLQIVALQTVQFCIGSVCYGWPLRNYECFAVCAHCAADRDLIVEKGFLNIIPSLFLILNAKGIIILHRRCSIGNGSNSRSSGHTCFEWVREGERESGTQQWWRRRRRRSVKRQKIFLRKKALNFREESELKDERTTSNNFCAALATIKSTTTTT